MGQGMVYRYRPMRIFSTTIISVFIAFGSLSVTEQYEREGRASTGKGAETCPNWCIFFPVIAYFPVWTLLREILTALARLQCD